MSGGSVPEFPDFYQRLHYYKLIGRLPVPVRDLSEWGRWMAVATASDGRRVAETMVGPLWISTVFTGLDYSFSAFRDADPILFETMIFAPDGGSLGPDLAQRRCSTWDQAERQHKAAVRYARRLVARTDAALAAAIVNRVDRFAEEREKTAGEREGGGGGSAS